jgi:hypothetical protein
MSIDIHNLQTDLNLINELNNVDTKLKEGRVLLPGGGEGTLLAITGERFSEACWIALSPVVEKFKKAVEEDIRKQVRVTTLKEISKT